MAVLCGPVARSRRQQWETFKTDRIMANMESRPTAPQGEERDAIKQHEKETGGRAGKWLRRAQAIVGIRTPGVRKRQGMCEAAERKARREMPYVDGPEAEDPHRAKASRGAKDAPRHDVHS